MLKKFVKMLQLIKKSAYVIYEWPLSIRENNISKLPGSIGRLERLVTLDMSYNQLEHLPPELGCCRSLNSLVC